MGLGLTINKVEIKPGSSEMISLFVGKLPSGAKISVKTHVFCSEREGPNVLLLAGLHGDEINGIEILRQSISSGMFDQLTCGNVIVIPILNIYGFVNFSRVVPDGKDVNRSFPGSMSGSLASRMASILTKRVLPVIDFGVDFHTGGDNRFNYPQVRYTRKDDQSKSLAEAFGAPYLVEKALLKKSLRKTARDLQKPIIVFEGGEALRLDGFVIETALKGLKRMLINQGMLPGEVPPVSSLTFRKSSWIRAKQAGIFIWSKNSGHKVIKGETLGSIYDPNGNSRIAVSASRSGFILGHNNTPVVHQGDALFHLGYNDE
ncbi:MAG: succinylglutamate desuccinylase/aspartoacylase family protein [Saprospiraceae bacterium]|nr:succinylglutamate desuccinylase/aspartoacylase family protein [Saprospiraceae bacterium]